MKHRNHTLHAVIATALLASAPLAFAHSAQQTPPSNTGSEPMMHQQSQSDEDNMQDHSMQNQSMQHNGMKSHSKMMGWHSMPGKVTSVDHQSGIVKVKTDGKNLRVHFPPNTITNLKKGDHISLDLGYKMKSSSDSMGHM